MLYEVITLVGAEVWATLALTDPSGAARALRLRIDRVDRRGAALLLDDYKTGKLLVTQQREASRREALLRAVASGKLLQAPAYAALARARSSYNFV